MSRQPTSNIAYVCFIAVVLGALLAGCAVGPNYKRPAVDSPPAFRDDNAPAGNSFADLDWWQVYRDSQLQGLIREALTNNYDLRLAMARVEQSRAVAMQARSQFVPSVDYNGVVSRGRNDLFGSAFPNNAVVTSSATATLNAFWEVDLWGRVRRLNESARAQFLASREARHEVRLSLLGEVASDYFRLLELDREMEIARRTTNSFGESLKIFTQRVEGGTASELESSRAEAALADAASAIPSIMEQISRTENELCVLLGRIPGPDQPRRAVRCGAAAGSSGRLAIGLLERRPDVRETEQLLRSANAQVGESVADFFPKIGLTTFLGKIQSRIVRLHPRRGQRMGRRRGRPARFSWAGGWWGNTGNPKPRGRKRGSIISKRCLRLCARCRTRWSRAKGWGKFASNRPGK